MKGQVNLNTIISGLGLALLLWFGKTTYDSNRATERLEMKLNNLAEKFELYAPKSYTDSRFQAVDAELKSIRAQLQANEVDLMKLRGKR